MVDIVYVILDRILLIDFLRLIGNIFLIFVFVYSRGKYKLFMIKVLKLCLLINKIFIFEEKKFLL